MEYNKIRYLELLEEAESLEKEGILLFTEDRDKYLELLKYEIRLGDQKSWENRKNYFSVINNFINERLTAKNFTDDFLYLWRKDRDSSIVNLEPNLESKGFGKWLNKIFFKCEVFEPDAQENEEYNEKWLKDSISNILIQIQKEYHFNENID